MAWSATNVLIGLVVSTSLVGCAGVSVHKQDTRDNGIRYYEPAPFLLIYSDSKGGLVSRIIWLPDTTQLMTLKPYAVFAKNDASFKFDKGVLTQAKSTADETVIPQAMVTALKTAAIAAMAAANTAKPAEVGEVPAPYLFRIDVRGDTVSLYGAERIPDAVSVTLVPQPKKPAAAPDKTANPPADNKDPAPTEEKDN